MNLHLTQTKAKVINLINLKIYILQYNEFKLNVTIVTKNIQMWIKVVKTSC